MKVEAEGQELILQNSNGDTVIIPKHARKKVLAMLKNNDHAGIDQFAESLPYKEDYAEDGTLFPEDPDGGVTAGLGVDPNNPIKKKVKPQPKSMIEAIPSAIRLAKLVPSALEMEDIPDYTGKYKSEEEAKKFARSQGYPEFTWNGNTISTKHPGTLQQQLDETGITNEQMYRKSKLQRNIGTNIYPFDYDDPFERAVSAAEGTMSQDRLDMTKRLKEYEQYKNVKDIPGYYENEKYYEGIQRDRVRSDVANFYSGIPQKYNTIRASNFRPDKETDKSSIYYALNDPDYETNLINNLGHIKEKRNQAMKDILDLKLTNPETLKQYQKDAEKYMALTGTKEAVDYSTEEKKFLEDFEKDIKKKFQKDIYSVKGLTDSEETMRNVHGRIKGITEFNPKTTGIAPTEPGAAMQNHQVTFGQDEAGDYVAYYDKWDIAPMGDKLSKATGIKQDFGKPMEFYNRLYYKVAGKNEDGTVKYELVPESEILKKKSKK